MAPRVGTCVCIYITHNSELAECVLIEIKDVHVNIIY